MSSDIKVDWGLPKNGWIQFSIARGDQTFSIEASYVNDPVAELAHALTEIAKGIDDVTVTLVEEPGESDLRLISDGGRIALNITSYPDHRRVNGAGRLNLEIQRPRLDICLAFWRALRRLESQVTSVDFERTWYHPFPTEKLQELTGLMKQMKADQAGGKVDRR